MSHYASSAAATASTNPFADDPSVKSETTEATGRSGRSESTVRMSNAAAGTATISSNTTTSSSINSKYLASPMGSSSEKKSLTKALRKALKGSNNKTKATAKDITVCVQTLDREKEDLERALEILRDEMKPMLMTFVNQNYYNNDETETNNQNSSSSDPEPIDKNLGTVTVEVLRHNGSNADIVEECAGVLYLLSMVNPYFKKAVARLFQAMQHHPTNINILEDSALAIQNVVHANPDSHIRIAPSLPILWNAMARHPDNALLVGAALNVLEDLTFNPEMISQRCMTESIPAVLKVLESPNYEIQIQACRILSELSFPNEYYHNENKDNENNDDANANNTNNNNITTTINQQTIGFNLNFLLACIRNPAIENTEEDPDFDKRVTLQAHILEVLANVAVHAPSHKHYVNRRAIPHIIKCLTQMPSSQAVVQACRVLANLTIPPTTSSTTATSSLRRTAGPHIVLESGGISAVLMAMKQHPNDAPLQIQACITLCHLCEISIASAAMATSSASSVSTSSSNSSSQDGNYPNTNTTSTQNKVMEEIISLGGIPLIITAIRQHSIHEELQIPACRTLYYLCSTPETVAQMTGMNAGITQIVQGIGTGGVGAIVRGMAFHASVAAVQTAGLQVLSRLYLQEDFELLLSEGGLDVLLTNLINFCDHLEICITSCEILKSFTRSVSGQSRDLQRAVASKEGIPTILNVMRKHVSHPPLQDAALACMRNLVLHPNNRPMVDEGGISTILVSMTVNSGNAAIQAYGCDALGRLAMDCSETLRYTIDVERGMQVALQAMKDHAGHPGVQDRVCFFLLNMITDNEDSNDSTLALESLQQLKPLPLLKEARSRMPPKGQERLELLIQKLQKHANSSSGSGIMGSIFGRNKS